MSYALAAAFFALWVHITLKRKPWPTVESLRDAQRKGEKMTASAETIRTWLEESELGGARWVLIKCEQDAHAFLGIGDKPNCCYPIALTRSSEVLTAMKSGDRTMEVYDLTLGIEEQMSEAKAWHPPEVSS